MGLDYVRKAKVMACIRSLIRAVTAHAYHLNALSEEVAPPEVLPSDWKPITVECEFHLLLQRLA